MARGRHINYSDIIKTSTILRVFTIFIISILICTSSLNFILPDNSISSANASSTWTHETTKNFKNGTLDNLSVVGSGEDAELKINLSGLHTWTKIPQSVKPSGGYYQEMTTIWGTDKVMLFGGFGYQNDTWEYDLSDAKWTKKSIPNSPPARYWQGMGSIWGDDKVILYGGQGTSSIFQDTWIYDSSNSTWTDMKPLGTVPYTTLTNNVATIWGTQSVLLWGGVGYDETWIYDLNINTWTKQLTGGSTPDARWYSSLSSIHGTDKVLMYGGQYNLLYYNETWIYDMSENTWTQIFPANDPGPRSYQAMFPLFGTDQVLLYGGWWSNYDDIWIFDMSANSWNKKIPTNEVDLPGSGWYHAMAPFYKTDQAVLFGGYYNYYTDDTWIYRHSSPTRNGTFESAAYDTGSSSEFKSINWVADVPANTSLRFQLRTAANGSLLATKDFVGPNGDSESYYTISPTKIWAAHYGDQWIQCKIFFNINVFTESLRLNELTISYNCLPNTVVIGPLEGILLANNEPLFLWTFYDFDSEVQNAFQVLIDDDDKFKSVDFDSGEQNTTSNQWQFPSGTNYTTLPDGSWYWQVRTKDDDGMWTEYSIPRSLIVDTTLPYSVTDLPINNGFYKSLNTIYGIATDGEIGSGIQKIEILIKRLSDNYYWNGSTWVPFIKWLGTSGTSEWTFDSSVLPWSSGTRYSVQSRAVDLTNNIELSGAINTFTIDMERPNSDITFPINDVWLNKLDEITGNSIDTGGSGVLGVEICIQKANYEEYWSGNAWVSNKYWLTTTGTDSWSYNTSIVSWTTGEKYNIISKATDNVNKIEIPGKGVTFNFDSQIPECSIIINNDDKYSTSNKVTITLTSKDFGSGVADMSFSTNGVDWSQWEAYNSTKEFELPEGVGDGERTVYSRVRDHTGNIGGSMFDSIILDRIPPEKLSILINHGAKYTANGLVTIDLLGTDSLSGLSSMSFSFDGVIWFPWEPFKLTRSISLTPEDGEKIIHYRAMDTAGNIAGSVFDSIILDTSPPYSLYIEINNGDTKTNSTLVTLDINALDNTSDIYQISFSIDGENWMAWEPFKHERLFTLSSNEGDKTIYIKAMDQAGNIAGPISTSIELNTSTPEIESQKPSKKASSTFEFWYILLIIIVILLIAFIALTLFFTKRLRRFEEQLLLPGTLTVKPDVLTAPTILVAKLGSAAAPAQLPATSGSSTSGAVAVPVLAKATQTAQQPQQQQTVVAQTAEKPVQDLPALPPAHLQAIKPEPEPAIPTATPQPTTTQNLQSQEDMKKELN